MAEHTLEYYVAQARRIAEHREAGAEKEIRKLYKSMLKDLQEFVSDTYVKYAEEDKLTFAMLQKAGYDARFLEEIEQRINVATPKAARELKKLVEDTYKLAYEGMVEGVAKSATADLMETFADAVAVTPEQIKAAVQNPVSGLTLKDTLEKNRREIIYSIKQTIGVGLMNGDRYTTMARRISEQVDGDYKKAVRIARTEAHRVREAGNAAAAERIDAEIRKGKSGLRMTKEWRTQQDERVRPQRTRKGKRGWKTTMGKGPNHMILQGQVVLADELFDLKDGHTAKAPGQSGVAGHDINCRCRASCKLMDDAEYFAKTGKHFPGWKNAEKSAETVENSAKNGTIESKKSEAFVNLNDALKNNNVEYREVSLLDKVLTDDEIISKLAGGDMTSGSCSSLGFAYIGNKNGFDVTDFRGGNSTEFFAKTANIKSMLGLPNVSGRVVKVKKEAVETAKIISGLEPGKEYYLAAGKHAAIIRRTTHGAEYLELQSNRVNGWTSFSRYGSTVSTLQQRFGCRKTVDKMKVGDQTMIFEKSVVLIDVDSFKDNEEFREILGYINTAEDKQKKGVMGNVK